MKLSSIKERSKKMAQWQASLRIQFENTCDEMGAFSSKYNRSNVKRKFDKEGHKKINGCIKTVDILPRKMGTV